MLGMTMTVYVDDSTGLSKLLKEVEETGVALANARASYYRAKNKRALQLKAEGMPVTLITETLKGYEEVAQARLEMDIAEVMFKVACDAHIDRRQQVRARNAQMEREWYS